MKRSNVLVTVGDGIDPRSEEVRAQSKAVAEAGRSANAEEVRPTFFFYVIFLGFQLMCFFFS